MQESKSLSTLAAVWALALLAAEPADAQFTSSDVDLLHNMTLNDFGSSFAEDCWGYVSPSGREYALIGLSQGTGFVEITDPANPTVVDIKVQANQGRDIKVYQDYVYSSSDSGPLHVYDVSDIDNGNVTFVRSLNVGTHNLAVDEVSGFLYLAVGGPTIVYDLTDPSNPSMVGTWNGESHDIQVVTYTSGPYTGRQIGFVFAGGSGNLDIVDFTDKSNIFLVGSTSYPNASYTHQGWLSEDRTKVFLNDELDGIPRTSVINVQDLTNPSHVGDFSNGIGSTDHNLYTHNGLVWEANYTSGLHIWDLSNPDAPTEVGFFDTYPPNNSPGFNGAWSVYPFFPSGNVIVSDIAGGLFVLDPSKATIKASVSFRNAGANPASYTADAPVLGTNWNASVDLTLTGHSMARVYGFLNSANVTLSGGQVLLGNGQQIFKLPLKSGPVASWTVMVPNDPALAGRTLHSQALHVFGVTPFALSNAQDLFLGY